LRYLNGRVRSEDDVSSGFVVTKVEVYE